MKAKAILLFIFLFLCFVTFEAFKLYTGERAEKKRLEQSFEAANKSLIYYETRNKLLAAQNEVLDLHYKELKDIYPKVISEIKNLDVKPRRVTQYTETVVRQDKDIVTRLKDSTVMDTVRVKIFSYQDSFYTVKGIAIRDTQHVHITSQDSLIQVVYKGRRIHPWLWIFSKRRIEQVITSKNPNSKIMYNLTINISKP